MAFYYMVLVCFFLVAAEIVRTGGQTILKDSEAVWNQLRISELWQHTADPPRFRFA